MGCHIYHLGSDAQNVPLAGDSVVFARMTHLRVLISQLLPLSAELGLPTFPPALQRLKLRFDGNAAAHINATLSVVSRLSMLDTLICDLPSIDEQLSFAPLALMPRLHCLKIFHPFGGSSLSDAQVAQLRALPFLERLDVRPMSTSLLRRLLAQPHELQWQRILLPDALDDEAAALRPHLPSLTALPHLGSKYTCSRFDFLRQLPNLTHADLKVSRRSDAGRLESLVAGLQCCSQIIRLALSSDLTAAHLSELLPRLPRLQLFCLCDAVVTTLSFLAQPPMTGQLTELELLSCSEPLTELRHVHSLRALDRLFIRDSFDQAMDSLSQSLFTPPSALMPQLEDFEYYP